MLASTEKKRDLADVAEMWHAGRVKKSLFIFAFIASSSLAEEAPKPSSPAFSALHALIQPSKEETGWLAIPWMTDLWAARQKAATEGKPIFLWEMDGHPLGCT